jgi:hypothetical protein
MGAASVKGREQRQRTAGLVRGGVPVAGKFAETHMTKFSTATGIVFEKRLYRMSQQEGLYRMSQQERLYKISQQERYNLKNLSNVKVHRNAYS